ncbi:MAG: lytic transglycosylase domain-containing protein [Ferruginibacter sp.]|nr:lytic transglycosylase domain-containing protein [Ferruginibacter sp.]
MKFNFAEQIGLFCMLVLQLNLAYSQPYIRLSLKNLLPDVPVITTNNDNSLKAGSDSCADYVISPVVPLQPRFQPYVQKYLATNGEILEQIRQTNAAKFNTIQKILVKRGIPPGMVYLAIVESELKNSATSRVGAAGIWQLMAVTGRGFGLKINGKIDERRNTYQSTVAATAYMKELYNQFDDWLLVVAAYNCGSGKVLAAIRQSGSRDFSKLQQYLPAESRSHVKHFLAVHYYFEKAGSIVTLTKKERLRYLATINTTVAKTDAPGTSVPGNTGNPLSAAPLAAVK